MPDIRPYDPILDPLMDALFAYLRQRADGVPPGMKAILTRMERLEDLLRENIEQGQEALPPERVFHAAIPPMPAINRSLPSRTIGSNG